MRFWIDIENSSGERMGSGPITTATQWQYTPELNGAGSFSFAMPASDPKTTLIQNKRIARCWTEQNGQVVERGAGIIDVKRLETGTPAMLQVSGSGIGRELTYRTLAGLTNANITIVNPTELDQVALENTDDLTNAYDGIANTYEEVLWLESEYLELRFNEPVGALSFYLTQFNNQESVIERIRCSAIDWNNLDFIDGTRIGAHTMAQSGAIYWPVPQAWLDAGGSGRIRIYISEDLSSIRINEISASNHETIPDDVSSIAELAPPGWTLNEDDWYGGTEDGSYLQFSNETILEALVKTAERNNEHFRILSNRTVEWMRSDTPASGVKAIGLSHPLAAEQKTNVCFIPKNGLRVIEDSYEEISRIYPFGAGNADVRLTLAYCTETPPAGYTLNTGENYIEKDGADPEIHRARMYSDIRALATDGTALAAAANQLFRAALADLIASSEREFYELEVIGLKQEVQVGETIRVIYRDVIDGYTYIDVDADLIVLTAPVTIDSSGVHRWRLTVATITRTPESDESLILGQIENLMAYQQLGQPLAASLVVTGA